MREGVDEVGAATLRSPFAAFAYFMSFAIQNLGASLILVFAILLSCSPAASPPATPSPAPPTPADIFEVEAWVDDASPPHDARVTVYGSLIKNGVRLGGMTMQATWPDETQERGVPNCKVQVIYGSGVCTLDAGNYPPGEFVPITVTFRYGGGTHVGHTGFTPQ